MTLDEKIEARIRREDGCWNWIGAYCSSGYPVINVGSKPTYVRRVLKRVPPKKYLISTCGNKGCVNPAHLKAVSRGEQMHRAIKKFDAGKKAKRTLERRKSVTTKLSVDKARDIRARALAGIERLEDIANEYGVRKQTVWQIKVGQIWRESNPWAI